MSIQKASSIRKTVFHWKSLFSCSAVTYENLTNRGTHVAVRKGAASSWDSVGFPLKNPQELISYNRLNISNNSDK